MRVARERLANSTIRVDDNFAQLIDIEPDGAFVYEFRFFSQTLESVRSLANVVRITVRKNLPAPPPDIFETARESGDLRDTIRNILVADAASKDTKRNNKADVILTVNSDMTARLNNALSRGPGITPPLTRETGEGIPPLARDIGTGLHVDGQVVSDPAGALGTQRVIDLRTIDSLKSENISPPVLQTMLFDHTDVPTQRQAQAAAIDLLYQGIDPSVAGSRYNCINSTFRAASGTGHIARIAGTLGNSTDMPPSAKKQEMLVTSLYQASQKEIGSLNDLRGATVVPVIADVPQKQILNFRQVRIEATSVGLDDFYVVFELVNVFGNVLETVTRRVSHNQFVRIYNTPRIPPRVSVAPAQFPGKNVVEIEQLDPRAVRVRIMRRVIKQPVVQSSSTVRAAYELVSEVPLKKTDGLMKFLDIVNNSSIVLYRCIPVGPAGLVGAEFTNAVASPVRQRSAVRHPRSNSASLTSRITPGGIELSVSNVPPSTVSVAVLRRDATLHETEFAFLGIVEPIRSVATNQHGAVFLDEDVKDDHIYEYECRLYFETGSEVTSTGYVLQQFKPLVVGVVSIEISNFELVRNAQFVDVRFAIRSKVSRENIDEVHLALKRQGLVELFQDDLELERDKLQSLIAHSIMRLDLTTGVQEDFGTFTGISFVDSVAGQKNAVSRLKEGHKYRYVISTLVRKAETVFDKLTRTEIDSSTGKSYTFKPSVFRHPVTLTKGTIVTRESLVRNHPEDDFAFGRVGNVRELDVTVDVPVAKIVDVIATRVDRRTASVRWNTEGQIADVEHFIIMKELLGQARIVGKTHNVSPGKSFEFLDQIEPDDIGDLNYRIVPVMGNYTRGQSVSSNAIRVIDIRSVLGA